MGGALKNVAEGRWILILDMKLKCARARIFVWNLPAFEPPTYRILRRIREKMISDYWPGIYR